MAKKKRGRPEFKPTEEQRQQVFKLASILATREEIATKIGCGVDTLDKYFTDEIQAGFAESHLIVKSKLREAILRNDITAIIFYLKTRCGWSDRQIIEHEAGASLKQIIIQAMPEPKA